MGDYIDLCTVGKGLQLAGTFFTEEYKPRPGLISGTFSASTAALAGGLRVLEFLEEGYMGPAGKIARTEKQFQDFFKELQEKSWIRDFNVFGLMSAFSLPDPSMENTLRFLKRLFQEGIIALSCGKDPARVRFLVPAVINKKEMEEFKKVLSSALREPSP